MDNLSYLSNADSAYIDSLYQSYKENPQSVDFGWQKFFEGFDFGLQSDADGSVPQPVISGATPDHVLKEINVLNMIDGFRTRGHLFTKTNPVRERRKYYPGKELETFGLSDADLDTVFNAGVEIGLGPAKLRDIYQLLNETYCESIGVEYKYMRNPLKFKWFEERIELSRNKPQFDIEKKKRILQKLNQAVVFESFLGTKFLGQKRFSLEGAEALIPALDSVIEKGAELGIEEFTIGMAHRGRLNVLTNIMGKTYKDVFSEFEGKYNKDLPFGGDVKYHLGFSTDVETSSNKKVHLSLCPNPSHLETVAAVVEGITRSKIDMKYGRDYNRIAPIVIHGDASVAGQGLVYEVLQMSKLDAYKTGGTIHLVINNQIGFTTNYKDARSSTYCTDIAKVTLSPVFHVNGDDVEALVYAINMAVEYRQRFHNDVFIDILCYRRYGHNESDEPRFTQPLLYKKIEKHPNPREIYVDKLKAQGAVDANLAKQMDKEFRELLQERLNESKEDPGAPENPTYSGAWSDLRISTAKDLVNSPDTSVDEKTFVQIANKITTLPSDKKFLSKVDRLFSDRKKMIENKSFDWAMGELMAYGTLVNEGRRVRISGQDVERGTFSHRHAVIRVEESEEQYTPLHHVREGQGPFEIYNSHLSEYGVLGFEYGYAMANPYSLTIWEAQFGDFANGAQIVIDQYISSAETKWQRGNGLVMLLPHGYEGQGPEHSSARIERFLELCAEDNMQIVYCSTPAQLFHALRRQLKRDFRKPLVNFSPKSLLRNPKCVSSLDDFTKGKFREVIDDVNVTAKDVKRVAICSGKIYYDLLEEQEKNNRKDVALVRLEQIYPTPFEQLNAIREKYKNAEFYWVQEEPENNGPWPFICRVFRKSNFDFEVISRRASSSPATGFAKQHVAEQNEIISKVFNLEGDKITDSKKAKTK
ncbi:2-oxoglutarate dehydrogenase, E1 subunit [Pseudopedobacter saltans DSM 12145]|uniref:oxoglutarate dehydrogenase (succinyl-transferring) n=1 Tax=Pseudopedobacter saltans (strain ATCC 51119 / DSM 12145 / JCM 21818 / CCUG 39354 / LMG 10337 / NBRC 100064 / NCIMB 13643) TaxID=762903 RepID=F0SE02_PSESL|nr:2-oxoglutarate dehydrogenase E1 component [Pseudopedobacter saltans]ADY52928.1 2-oxoglutarate dehydrogenase, E1 subunit [Pseudopedobacter saltans DSM 12145]